MANLKNNLIRVIAMVALLVVPTVALAARTSVDWVNQSGTSYIQPNFGTNGMDLLILGSNHYINFNTVTGLNGYGIRDNGGTMEFKNSGGAWTGIGTGGGSGGTGAATSSFAAVYPVKVSSSVSAITYSLDFSTTTSNYWSAFNNFSYGINATLSSSTDATTTRSFYLSALSGGFLAIDANHKVYSAASSSLFGFTPASNATTITIAGTANQITSSAGAQDLSANRTWTLTLPSLVIIPGNASSSQESIGNRLFVGGTATTTINSTGDLFVAGSTTLQNVTAVNATSSGIGILNSKGCSVTSALTTDVNGTIVCGVITGSGTFAYPFIANATSSLLSFTGGIIAAASSSITNLSIQNSTTTNATTTSLFATVASTSLLYVTGLTTCDPTTGKITWANGTFGCGTDQSGSSGAAPFTFGVTDYGTSTAATTTSIWSKGVFFSSSTVAASQFPYASSTAITTGNFFVTGSITLPLGSSGAQALVACNGTGVGGPCTGIGPGADGTVLMSAGGGATWASAQINLASSVTIGSSILGVVNGGTAANGFNKYPIVGGGGTSALSASSTLWVVGINATGTVANILPFASTTAITATTASTTNLIVSSMGGTGTRCVQVAADGTVSAAASACGSGGAAGAQGSTTVAFVIYPIDQTSNPSQYFMYNASSTIVTQSASFQTLLKNAMSSIGAGGSYSGTSKGNGPGGAVFLTQGTFYSNATTTCNGNEQFSTLNAPRCEVFGAGQEATKVVVVGGSDFMNFDHGAIPSVHDMAIYLTGFEKGIVSTSSNPNIRSIWQFDFRNLSFESTTTFATTTAFYLGNVLRGNIENIDSYGLNNTFWFYAEGNFNVGGATVKRSFMDFSSAATSTAFKFTQQSTGFVNEIEGYYNEAIGRTTGATYIDSTGLAFSHFNDSSAEQMDVLVDGKAGTVSNLFDFAYSINRNGGANLRGCRFWPGSYDNQCSFQNGNNDASAAIIDDMNSNTDFPNRIAGSVTQSAGTGSASSTAVANYQIINFHGSGTFDTNFKPDTDWAGYQIWSKVIAKSYKSFLSGANAASGMFINIDTSIATNVGVFIQDNTNFAHAGDLIRLVFKNASDSGNALDIQNLGTGNSIIATSTRGTDFVVTGLNGFTGVGTTTPWGLFSVLPNAIPNGRPAFVVGSTSATYFLINNGGKSGFGTTTPFGFFSINPNNIGTAPLFVIGSSSVTNFLVKSANVAALLVGSSTAPVLPATITGFFVNQPAGTGAFASTTVDIGDPSTTTSRSQIQMNSNSGAPVCIDVRGTTLTVTAGICP